MIKERNIDFIWTLMEGVFWAIISMIWYKPVLFRCIDTMTYTQSKMILWCILIVSVVFGALIECYSKRGWSVVKTLLIAYGLYTVLTYGKTLSGRVNVILWGTAIAAVLYAMLVMMRKIRRKGNTHRIVIKRLLKCLYAYGTIFSFGMGILLFSLVVPLVFGNSLFRSSVEATNADAEQEQTIENNIDTLLLLQQKEWYKLNVEQKLDVMQVVANIEVRYLGIPHELNVSVINLEGDTLGNYNDGTRTINISLSHLENDPANEVLDSCLHEVYHCYQFRLVDAYNSANEEIKNLRIYKKAVSYLQEFGNYIDGDKDFDGYYQQLCEADARKYAKDAVTDYYNKINKYLNPGETDAEAEDEVEVHITYDERENAYLADENDTILAGPYKVIEYDFDYSDIIRYMDENGLYGYLNKQGTEITEPVFQEASIFESGTAMVSMEPEKIYYIDSSGKRITKDYLEGYPFEHQGRYARVKSEDGTWGIIDRTDEMHFTGADYIEELPMVTTLGCAVVNGHAVLFGLNIEVEEEISVIKTFEEFCDISVCLGKFAIVTNEQGLKGVVNWNGDIYAEAEYKDITYEIVSDNVLLKLQKTDGSYETMNMY